MAQRQEARTEGRPDAMALASLRARRYGTGLRRFAKTNVMSATAGVVGLLLILISIAAPVIAPADPLKVKLSDINADPSIRGEFIPFGRDHIGRDVLSRVIYGGRISLFVGFVAVLLGTSGGFVWGLTSGYFGGKFDLINQRVVEVLLSFPGLILAMALAMALGASMWTVIIAIGVTRLAPSARVVRAVALSIKETTYVDAARALGANPLRIMTAHIAPQCVAPFLIVFTASLGGAIVTEASLSFLGVGIPPPDPSWGTMLAEASGILLPHWYLVVFPGLFITVTVLAFNLFGDGLRDALDPRLRGST